MRAAIRSPGSPRKLQLHYLEKKKLDAVTLKKEGKKKKRKGRTHRAAAKKKSTIKKKFSLDPPFGKKKEIVSRKSVASQLTQKTAAIRSSPGRKNSGFTGRGCRRGSCPCERRDDQPVCAGGGCGEKGWGVDRDP